MTKPLKISEEAAVQMPMKTVASLIMMVAIGTWAYFGLHETLNNHATKIELMKMCGRVNSNPSLALNSNFDLLVSKCRGVAPARDNTRPVDSQSLWDDMKDEYKKENPEVNLMGDKFIKPSKKKLIIPKYLTEEGSVILPLPKPKDD